MLYITYFAPQSGENPALLPNEFFYQQVWTKSLAERRTMNLGMERVARADRFRFYDSDLDGVEHDFTDNPDIGAVFPGA
jgi:hypothetical protein